MTDEERKERRKITMRRSNQRRRDKIAEYGKLRYADPVLGEHIREQARAWHRDRTLAIQYLRSLGVEVGRNNPSRTAALNAVREADLLPALRAGLLPLTPGHQKRELTEEELQQRRADRAAAERQRRARNPELTREKKRQQGVAHRDRINVAKRVWYAANREKELERHRLWKAENPDKAQQSRSAYDTKLRAAYNFVRSLGLIEPANKQNKHIYETAALAYVRQVGLLEKI